MSVLACFGLSIPSKLTVVLFSGHSSFFPPGDISSGSVLLANIKKTIFGDRNVSFYRNVDGRALKYKMDNSIPVVSICFDQYIRMNKKVKLVRRGIIVQLQTIDPPRHHEEYT